MSGKESRLWASVIWAQVLALPLIAVCLAVSQLPHLEKGDHYINNSLIRRCKK